ncbi:hypothetical protein WJX84_002096 [Apatococcus fuscideae]|uniref:Patatin n=1 Tax=Apatococcus fuscideae TaxID=2026836 RepID=A0AAW1SXR5_9CHLO
MKPDRQVAAVLEHFLNSAGWTVDHLYASFAARAGLTQPYFQKGWGDLSIIDFAEDAKLLSDWPSRGIDLQLDWTRVREGKQAGVQYELLEGSFRTPCSGRLYDALPEPSRTGRVQLLRPVRESDWKGCVVHLAGTGDHTFHRRIRLGDPLVSQGIATMALESPFYGRRRPQGQQGAKLARVSDLLTLGRATIEESLWLLRWAQHNGFPQLGMSGFSMGGVHASMVAGLFPGPVACIPLLAPRSAAVAFCYGALWQATAWQPFASNTDENEQDILNTLARAIQPNEVTQAARHALNPTAPATGSFGLSSSCLPKKPHTDLQSPAPLAMSPPVASVGSSDRSGSSNSSSHYSNNSSSFTGTTGSAAAGDGCWQDAMWDKCTHESSSGTSPSLLSMTGGAPQEPREEVRQALGSAWQHAKGWRREQACLRLAQVLETYTDVTRFPKPKAPEAAILVAATNDAFVASSSVQQLAQYWQGCEVRWVSVMAGASNMGTKQYRLASQRAVKIIYAATDRLELEWNVEQAAVCLWHSYFAKCSFQTNNPFPFICASLAVAAKCLDSPRRPQKIAHACCCAEYSLREDAGQTAELDLWKQHARSCDYQFSPVLDAMRNAEHALLYATNFDLSPSTPSTCATQAIRKRILGGQPDSFKVTLGYQVAQLDSPRYAPPARLHKDEDRYLGPEERHFETSDVQWTEYDTELSVLERLRLSSVVPPLFEEHVAVVLQPLGADYPAGGVIRAAAPTNEVEVRLVVAQIRPQLRRMELTRMSTSGAAQQHVLSAIMREVDLEGVTRLKCSEGLTRIWEDTPGERLACLRVLNLNHCGLTGLPATLGSLTNLRELRLAHNRLSGLPQEIGSLKRLQKLDADHNLLAAIPVDLRYCSDLRIISLESNRLTTPVLDLRALSKLRSLQLYGNPLEFLMELSPCTALRHLSLANVRMSADPTFLKWEVEVVATSYMGRTNKLAALFAIIFRRSACQHPLLAGALGRIAEDPLNCATISKESGAVQQLILMALSDNEIVVEQACKTLCLLGTHNSITTNEIIESNVLSAMLSLISSCKHKSQLAGLRVLGVLALTSDAAAAKLLTPRVEQLLLDMVRSHADDVKTAALDTIGNMAFCKQNSSTLRGLPGLHDRLCLLSASQPGVIHDSVRRAAIRSLAILGENEHVAQAVGRPSTNGRGIRILSMDGGGMKGIAIIRLLRQLEERTGRRIHELFDLICGTSTGGILAVALALRHFTLDECEQIYRTLGQRVFSKPLKPVEEKEGWRESLYRVYKSGQQSMRVAVYGCKHDAVMFEMLLKQFCHFEEQGCTVDRLIDTAALGRPKCFVVATLASMTPASAFLFRNYEHPRDPAPSPVPLETPRGSSKHEVWQAVRASSAAPYYLDDFLCGADRFQDGASTANNPAGLAIQEARSLWPDSPIDCLVSLGSGNIPLTKREKNAVSSYLDTGSVLIESACDVSRVDAMLSTLLPMIPNFKYFRFCATDPRCGMELDEIDPAIWELLEAATDDYIEREDARLDAAASWLIEDITVSRPYSITRERLDAGAQKGILLVEGFRAHGEAPTSHVEAVGRLVSRLPQCLEVCSTSGRGEPADGASASSNSFPQILGIALQRHCGGSGILHLALHGNPQGLVRSWQQTLLSVAEPGEAADMLVARIRGHKPGDTIGGLLAANAWLELEDSSGAVLSQLSRQQLLVGSSSVSSWLLQQSTPASMVLPSQILGQLRGRLHGLLVVTSSVAPVDLVSALLRSGARCVICKDAAAAIPEATAAADFFETFYSHLFAGTTIMSALAAAGERHLALAHTYCCCYLHNGEVIAAEQAAVGE